MCTERGGGNIDGLHRGLCVSWGLGNQSRIVGEERGAFLWRARIDSLCALKHSIWDGALGYTGFIAGVQVGEGTEAQMHPFSQKKKNQGWDLSEEA